jgi:hypothetical protein
MQQDTLVRHTAMIVVLRVEEQKDTHPDPVSQEKMAVHMAGSALEATLPLWPNRMQDSFPSPLAPSAA